MLVLLRFSGEISTKARQTRISFTHRLVHNISSALKSENIKFELRKEWSRIFLETADPKALGLLSHVFGIRSLSVVERLKVENLEEIVSAGVRKFCDLVSGKSFAVRARRAGGVKDPRFPSKHIESMLGARLLPYAKEVNLSQPEITVNIEIHGNEAYFFTEMIPGPGGLPLGTQERAVALISGGFDSAVAAWQVLKRGVALDYLFLNLAGRAHLASMLPVLKILADHWSHGDLPKLYVVDFLPVIQNMQAKTEMRYWQVLLKRQMVRAAGSVAEGLGSYALVTGEAIGQVSSQTLPNLAVISEATSLPILRPLVGFDKHEIIERARDIGTAELSKNVEEYCALVARNPATSASLTRIKEQEQLMDFSILERAVKERAELDLLLLDSHLADPLEFAIEEVPDEALVIDLRPFNSYRAWHFPRAIHLDFFKALADFESVSLDRDRPIVLYCEIGVKSAQLAERMRQAGYQSYHFAGGMKKVMAHAIERELVPIELLPPSAWPD